MILLKIFVFLQKSDLLTSSPNTECNFNSIERGGGPNTEINTNSGKNLIRLFCLADTNITVIAHICLCVHLQTCKKRKKKGQTHKHTYAELWQTAWEILNGTCRNNRFFFHLNMSTCCRFLTSDKQCSHYF